MVKRFLSIRLIYSVIFICSVFPANASQYKASVLQSRIYAGQQLTQTDDDYFKSFGVVASENDAASTVISNPYNFSKLPLLIGLPVDKVTPYVRMYGPIFDSPLVNLEPRTLDFQVDDVEVNTFFAKKVSATELFYYPSSEEASREVEAVGYYLHDGNLTTSNYIFHDAVIFNPKQTPYYQEIRKKFKRSNLLYTIKASFNF